MSDRPFWIALNRVPGIGPARMRALLDRFGSAAAVWGASPAQLAGGGLDRRTIESLVATRGTTSPEREMALLEKVGATALTWEDEAYPRLLRDIPAAPPVLYLRGALTVADEWAVALVGTRRMSGYGKQVTETLAAGLAQAGMTIVSGLALGVDRIAHEAALAAGGRTLAVLANGVEKPYPAANRRLAERIVAEGRGALVSDYPIGTRPDAANFPPRNRIISGLSVATIVVEAGERSGALITAQYALEQGRDVFAVPGSIFSPTSRGTNDLLSQGAQPAHSVEAVLRALDVQLVEPQRVVRQAVAMSADEEMVLALLSGEAAHIDELGQRCTLSPAALGSTLALLELKGLVRQQGAMRYART